MLKPDVPSSNLYDWWLKDRSSQHRRTENDDSLATFVEATQRSPLFLLRTFSASPVTTLLRHPSLKMPPAKKAKLTGGKTGGNALAGLTFAITGPLSQTRKHFEDLISSNGGHLAGSVTKAVRLTMVFYLFTCLLAL